MYGFEVFEKNTFEQLCINYANEKLQSYFASKYLLNEGKELSDEGFDLNRINEECRSRLKLFDEPISLFSILNEVTFK